MLRTLKRVFAYAKPYIGYFAMTLIFAAGGISLSLAVPVFIGEAVDVCVTRGQVNFSALKTIVLKLAAIVVVSGVFQWIMTLCTKSLYSLELFFYFS